MYEDSLSERGSKQLENGLFISQRQCSKWSAELKSGLLRLTAISEGTSSMKTKSVVDWLGGQTGPRRSRLDVML